MRYTDATLNNYTARALEAIARASSLEHIKVHIAKGNRKVGRVRNVSLMSRICCGNCKTCDHYCYDIKAALQYENVMRARAENTALAYRDLKEYFDQIAQGLSDKAKVKAFRFHVGGEILSEEYLEGMVETARKRPGWRIWTYTKMHDLVNGYIAKGGNIPENLTIMYSKDATAVVNNPYGMPEAYTVVTGDTEEGHGFKCPGNCEICLETGRGCPFGESVYFLEH